MSDAAENPVVKIATALANHICKNLSQEQKEITLPLVIKAWSDGFKTGSLFTQIELEDQKRIEILAQEPLFGPKEDLDECH